MNTPTSTSTPTPTPAPSPAERLSSALGGAHVTFDPFRDAKIVWTEEADGLSVRVSDHFATAPDAVLDALGWCILGMSDDDTEIRAWMMSSAYREANRGLYLKRSRRVDTVRDVHRLYSIYGRLLDSGAVERIDDLLLFWARGPDGTPSPVSAEASATMRVISVNPVLTDAPDNVLESVLLDCLERMSRAIAEDTISYDMTHSLVLGGDIRGKDILGGSDKDNNDREAM